MEDQKDKPKSRDEHIIKAINEIAATKNGRIFFRWLAHRCFQNRSTIVGNPETFEVNTVGTIAQEFNRKLFQEIYRNIRPDLRIKIDYPNQNDE